MGGFLYFGALVLVVAFVFYMNHRMNQSKEIAFDEVPELVRDEVQRRVPNLEVDRVMRKRDSYKLLGHLENIPLQFKVKLRGIGAGKHVYKVQIQLETRSSYRSLKGKHRIAEKDVPGIVMQRARQAAESYAGPIEKISRIKAATVQGRDAYDIRGWAGEWRVEVELLDDGAVLEVELDYRPEGPK
mgnify:CR=1 FL=1